MVEGLSIGIAVAMQLLLLLEAASKSRHAAASEVPHSRESGKARQEATTQLQQLSPTDSLLLLGQRLEPGALSSLQGAAVLAAVAAGALLRRWRPSSGCVALRAAYY